MSRVRIGGKAALMLAVMIVTRAVHSSAQTAPAAADSLTNAMPSAEPREGPPAGRQFSPAAAAGRSALVPGLGQAYTGHYAKAVLFFATEATMAVFAGNRYQYCGYKKDIARAWADSANYYALLTSSPNRPADSVLAARDDSALVAAGVTRDLSGYDERLSRRTVYHAISWMAGCYVFNIMDALAGSRYFVNYRERSPVVAGWLSAVPFLALGQVYNGSLSKAGMIFMAQTSLGLLAYDYHVLMVDCEKGLDGAARLKSDAVRLDVSGSWESRRKYAFRNRNTYLWYSLIFYFYGVFDAVVDAHLHDAPVKMRLKPDLALAADRAEVKVNWDF